MDYGLLILFLLGLALGLALGYAVSSYGLVSNVQLPSRGVVKIVDGTGVDKIIFTIEATISEYSRERIGAWLNEIFPHCRIVVIDQGATLTLVKERPAK